jgi:putative ATPase
MPDDLFAAAAAARQRQSAPLADRMRPQTLDDFVGQAHVLAPGRLLRRAVEADRVTSLILFGPPGTGKTTLARIIANTTRKHFASLNAVLAGVKDIREQIGAAQERQRLHGQGTILFVDEVHRFNKAQQDALLPHVENGTVVFVGATTENPYFEVNKALVSRSRVFELHTLAEADLRAVVAGVLADAERGYGGRDVEIDDDALGHLVSTANGDARSLLNALELAVETTEPDEAGTIRVTLEVAEDSIQRRAVLYDKDGDAHYDTVSAFIKSMRGSDPDAALYWMARMIYAGEDPRFVLRRLLIFACEDVGLADPRAVEQAVACARAFDYVGMPEGRFMLGQLCVYLATAPKSNSGFAFFSALEHVEKERTEDVPNPLKDGSRDKKGLGHGVGYKYPHAYRDHYVPEQYLPGGMQGTYFYEPSDQGAEARIAERLDRLRQRNAEASIEKRVRRYAEDDE